MQTAGDSLAYDRRRVTPGIVHLGVGAFHRAHMAAYTDDLLAADPSWGIVGASLRSPDTFEALAPQDFLYTLAVRDGTGTKLRIAGSIVDVLVADRRRQALLSAMVDPRIRIVSLTVTEKGYCRDPATGRLRDIHPDIVHDLADPASPVSAPGLLARAIELRRAAGIAPFTVLSCDNLPANGATTRQVVADFAALRGGGLAAFVEREVAFPSTMVDRIVPATTDEDRHMVAEASGLVDAWPVVTEPFSQWVVEDRFPTGRPDFASVGVTMTSDVKPFETMKLRMLNGSHSTLAYLGHLSGYEFVSDAIADPALRRLIHEMMTEEVMPTLSPELGNLAGYRDSLLGRFANPALKHRTWQIAMDGSQKLPQRLLGTIRDGLAQGFPVERAALGVAAWMRYAGGRDDHGRAIDVRDPLAARLAAICDVAGANVERLVDGFLAIGDVFDSDLPANPVFRESLVRHLTSLRENGARRTVETMVGRLR
jgi:fructuronate reductase